MKSPIPPLVDPSPTLVKVELGLEFTVHPETVDAGVFNVSPVALDL